MRFVIIDSGLNGERVENNVNVEGITVDIQNGATIFKEGFDDEFGHGTAVADIFTSNILSDNYDIFVIKVFFDDYRTSSEHLCSALEYINDNIDCELVLVSAGIRVSENYDRLQSVIDKLVNKKVMLISAFDNNGAMSYPAALDNVIGVDISKASRKKENYIVLENSPVNVIGCDMSFRVKWIDNKKNIVRGSSFVTAYIAAVVANFIIANNGRISYEQCLELLKRGAVKVVCYEDNTECENRAKQFMSSVKTAIVFPFNKEIHSLAKFENLLCVDILDFYDIRQSGMVGMKIREVTKHIESERVIKDYELINWEEDFDTVILGHTRELSKLINRDLTQWFVDMCKVYNKKLYSFDDIEALVRNKLDENSYFIPKVKDMCIVRKNNGKQYLNSKPVLGIFGTSSRQGKYTLQLMLREKFLKDGYNVAQIGTEPTGYLFGFDYVYPMGYNSAVYVKGYEAISRLNLEMHKCERENSDIIITGSQSQTVPRINYNISHFNLAQMEFIIGTQPDVVVLCVNLHDDITYVERTIKYIEGICRCKVIGCCLYPRKVEMENGVLKKNRSITEEECLMYGKCLYEKTELLLYRLDSEEDITKLYELIIEKFT